MEDKLISQFQERFAGHASNVDPGVWDGIAHKLAVANGEVLRQTMQQKFSGHEVEAGPQAWANISSQLGHGAAAGTGTTVAWWAAGIAATIIAGAALLIGLKDHVTTSTPLPSPPTVAHATPASTEGSSTEHAHALPASAAASQGAVDGGSHPAEPTRPEARRSTTGSTPSHAEQSSASNASNAQSGPSVAPAGTSHPEGEKTVNAVLQDIVDHYVTSPVVVATEKKVPPPSQEEMPSEVVHPQHEETELNDTEPGEPEIHEAVPELAIMIPTAFSPNSDGVNDELAVTVQNYQKAVVRIFSASSNALVFAADNLEARWNGRVMNTGQPCEPGMYFYALEVSDANGRTWSKGEVVRLFR